MNGNDVDVVGTGPMTAGRATMKGVTSSPAACAGAAAGPRAATASTHQIQTLRRIHELRSVIVLPPSPERAVAPNVDESAESRPRGQHTKAFLSHKRSPLRALPC